MPGTTTQVRRTSLECRRRARGVPDVTTIREHAISGDFRFASSDGQQRGVVLGKLVASRYNAWPGDKINLVSICRREAESR